MSSFPLLKTISVEVASVSVSIASRIDGIDVDHCIVSSNKIQANTAIFSPSCMYSVVKVRSASIGIYRYADLLQYPVFGQNDISLTSLNIPISSDVASPVSPLMHQCRGHQQVLNASFSTPLKVCISGYIIDMLSYTAETFSSITSDRVAADDTVVLAGNTTRLHHCSQLVLSNQCGIPIVYRQQGVLDSRLLPPGERHNFTWQSLLHRHLRLSCHSLFWSSTVDLDINEPMTVQLHRPDAFVNIRVVFDDHQFQFLGEIYASSDLPFSLEFRASAIYQDQDTPVNSVVIIPSHSKHVPVPIWLSSGELLKIQYQVRPYVSDGESLKWRWSHMASSAPIAFKDSSGNIRRYIWAASTANSFHFSAPVTIRNNCECDVFIRVCSSTSTLISPHDCIPFEWNICDDLTVCLSTSNNGSVHTKVIIPEESSSLTVLIPIENCGDAISVTTLDPILGLRIELFSTVTVRNVTGSVLKLSLSNNEERVLADDSTTSLFFPHISDLYFTLSDSAQILCSQQLHGRRSGTFSVDLCSPVTLYLMRLSMIIEWSMTANSRTFDVNSRCLIVLQSRYVLHNKCPFPISYRAEMPSEEKDRIIVASQSWHNVSFWGLQRPPIHAIHTSPSFESGAWVEDTSSLRISRESEPAESGKNLWGWSPQLSCTADNDGRILLRIRSRSGYDIILSCFKLRRNGVMHVIIFSDVQVPLFFFNSTNRKFFLRFDSARSMSPTNVTVDKFDLEPMQSTQIAPSGKLTEERIFYPSTHRTPLYLRCAESDWTLQPVMLADSVQENVVLNCSLDALKKSTQPHMLGSSPTRSVQRNATEVNVKVDCYERNGTLLTFISNPDADPVIAKPFSQLFQAEFVTIEVCFITDAEDTVACIFLDKLKCNIEQRHNMECAPLISFLHKFPAVVPGRTVAVSIQSFQIDHLQFESFPVVAHVDRLEEDEEMPFVDAEISLGPCLTKTGVSGIGFPLQSLLEERHVQSIFVKLAPIRTNIEDAFISTLTSFASEVSQVLFKRASGTFVQQTESTPDYDWQAQQPFLASLNNIVQPRFSADRFHLAAVQISVSYSGSRAYLGCQSLPVRLSAVELKSVLSSSDRLIKELSANYLADVIMISPLLFGSMDLLGNPTQLISSFSKGIQGLVRLPSRALTRGPRALAWATLQGIGSLLQNISEGTLTSVSGFTHSLARNVDGVSPSYYHLLSLDQNAVTNSPRGISQGVVSGATSLATGVFLGVTGVVSAPIRGAMQQGSWGFIKGLGAGVAGVISKPVSGALEMVSQTSRGLASAAGVSQSSPDLRFVAETSPSDDDVLSKISTVRLRVIAHTRQETYRKHFRVGRISYQNAGLLCSTAILLCTRTSLNLILSGSDSVSMSLPYAEIRTEFTGSNEIVIIGSDVAFIVEMDHLTRQSFLNCINDKIYE
eukprot:CRZ01321.1 hypothetical protein [Spongospora subterranea]